MRRWLANLPIRSKLLLLVSLASSLALLAAGVVLAVADYHSGTGDLVRRLQSHAEMAAMHSRAALSFDDAEAAERTLDALGTDRAVLAAEIRRTDGSVLAQKAFRRTGDEPITPARPEGASARSAASDFEVSAEATLGGQRVGTVHVWASDRELIGQIKLHGAILFIVLLGAFGISVAATSLLQRVVTSPILALERAADTVSTHRDYSVRVAASGEDEVGRLVRTFNGMVEQLGEREREAGQHRAKLESEVQARTADLQVALRESQAATRAKADFLANMSHEIRTPMNGVIGMLDLLSDTEVDAESRSMLETARNSADALLTLINDVLDFSKIDAGKLTLERIDVELRPLAEEVATLFTKQAQTKGLEVTCAVHNDVPAIVGGDPTRLRQVMVNLMANAVKFTERGEVLLGIQLRGAMIQILIQDTGIGMTPEVRDRLFQAFTQADSSTTRKYGGTGLGLAITKALVDAMGGSIRVKSTPGVGSIFSIFLPLEVRSRAQPMRAPNLQGLKALIVDDNPTNRCILEHYLTHEEASHVSTSSARAGLEVARAASASGVPFDVVLLDYQMPEMDGVGFLRELRADPSISKTKCIVLSSLGDRVAQAEALGVAAWLTKPVRKAQLQNMLTVLTGRGAAHVSGSPLKGTGPAIFPGARVLLVEDNRTNREVALRMLKTFRIEAVAAADGVEAVQALKTGRFDLVLMDIQMPRMDGYEAARVVRAWEAESATPRTPIVAMTANAMQGDREKCFAAGMDDYVAKPIKREPLAKAIERFCISSVARASEPAIQQPADAERALSPLEHGSNHSSGDSALDPAALDGLRELMGDELAHVICTYLSDTPAQIETAATAIVSRDYEVLGRAAHSMKSSSRSLGAMAVGRVAEAIEILACDKGSFAESERLLAVLRVAFSAVEPRLLELAILEEAKHGTHASGTERLVFVKSPGRVTG